MHDIAVTWVQRLIKGNKAGDPIWCHSQFVAGALLLWGAICPIPFRFQQQRRRQRPHFFTCKMRRPLLGKSLLSLASPLLESLISRGTTSVGPAMQPLPRKWGFKQGKMDLEGVPGQSTHTSLLCIPRHYLPRYLPAYFSCLPFLLHCFLFFLMVFFFFFVRHYSTWL